MTTTTRRPLPLDHRTAPSGDRDTTTQAAGAVLPNGNPIIPLPPSTHPAEELVHPWTD